jgi:hypothetical protein
MGVTMPSFKPLSTVMSRRTLDGTTLLTTTGRPQSGVGRRKGCRDQQHEPNTQVWEQPVRQPPSGENGER